MASGPPSNTAYQAHRAFEAGWGGIVWKTIGDAIVNTSSRYSGLNVGTVRMAGFNNIELTSDRAPETNFREITEVKQRWPGRPTCQPRSSTRTTPCGASARRI